MFYFRADSHLLFDSGNSDSLGGTGLDFLDQLRAGQLVGGEVVQAGDGGAAQRLANVLDVLAFNVLHHHDLDEQWK